MPEATGGLPEVVEPHFYRIMKFLRTDFVEVCEADFGAVVIKGNYNPTEGTTFMKIHGQDLGLEGKVLHERVLVIEIDISIRSHQEEDNEVVVNIGDVPIVYISYEDKKFKENIINPGEAIFSVWWNKRGHFHGFKIEYGKVGLLYVAKALKPEFVKGNSFIVPENTYDGPSADD